jgi:hypothetical protein
MFRIDSKNKLWYNNGMSTSKQNSKSILARALATENIRVEHSPNTSTAMFDVANRVLVLPVWKDMSDEVYDMFVGHEVGHALFTPDIDKLSNKVSNGPWCSEAERIGGTAYASYVQGLINIVEDVRIEKMIKDKYPGLRRDFYIGYNDLEKRDFFGTKGKNLNEFSFPDRINLRFKCGASLDVPFTDEEMKYVDLIDSCKTFDDVVRASEEVYRYLRGQKEENKTLVQTNANPAAMNSSTGENGNGSSSQMVTETVSNEKSEDPNGTPMQSNGDKKQENNSSSKSSNGAGSGLASELDIQTQKKFNENQKNMVDQDVNQVYYSSFRLTDHARVILPYKKVISTLENYYNPARANNRQYSEVFSAIDEKFAKFTQTMKPLINTLIKQFEMRKAADVQKRTSVSRSGKIDADKIYKYRVSDDIFLRFSRVADGKNHGLVMFIDWSSSMQPATEDVLVQVLILSNFCRRMSIPFDVYMFTSQYIVLRDHLGFATNEDMWNADLRQWVGKVDDHHYTKWAGMSMVYNDHHESFALIQILSSNMTTKEFASASKSLYTIGQMITRPDDIFKQKYVPGLVPDGYRQGNTPLDSTIVAAMTIVPEFREKHKLQIVNTIFLTDGDTGQSPLRLSSGSYRTKVYTRCPITKKEFCFSDINSSTDCLLEIFKHNTQSTTIGFFVCCGSHCKYFEDSKRDRKILRDNGFLEAPKVRNILDYQGNSRGSITNHGYDKLFILPSDIDIDDEFSDLNNVDTSASLIKIRNAFMNSLDKRSASRLFLNRFADVIANPNTK